MTKDACTISMKWIAIILNGNGSQFFSLRMDTGTKEQDVHSVCNLLNLNEEFSYDRIAIHSEENATKIRIKRSNNFPKIFK